MDALLKQAIDGARAFEDLAKLHRPALVRLAVRLLGNEADAEDAVQEALIDALLGLVTYDEKRGTVKVWLCGYVKKECEKIRRERDAVSTVALDEAIEIAGGDPLEIVEVREAADEARSAIAKLPKAQREAFEMHADGMSVKEIAGCLGKTEQNVRNCINRAKNELKITLFADS